MVPVFWFCGTLGGEFRSGTMASVHLDVRHFSFSLYATDAFQDATQLMEHKRSESG